MLNDLIIFEYKVVFICININTTMIVFYIFSYILKVGCIFS